MTWSAQHTFITNEMVTAAMMNAMQENSLHLRGYGEHACSIYNNGTQTVTAGNTTALTLNGEVYDTSAMHSTSVLTNRIVCPVTGKYFIFYSSYMACNNNGTGALHLRLDGNIVRSSYATSESADFGDMTVDGATFISVSGGQYFDLAGSAASNDFTFGGTVDGQYTRIEVIGPFPNP